MQMNASSNGHQAVYRNHLLPISSYLIYHLDSVVFTLPCLGVAVLGND
jgi:hypothetical protein